MSISETAKHSTHTEGDRTPEPAPAALPAEAQDESAFLADPLAGLSDAEVRRLKRTDLLEILVAQGDEIARLRVENDRLRQSAAASQADSQLLSELLALVRSLGNRQQEQQAILQDILHSAQQRPAALPVPAATEPAAATAEPSQPKASAAGLARKLFSAASHINS